MAGKQAHLLISVIIPTLNEAENIGPTVASVQQETGVEILVVDGGSRDATVVRARQFCVQVLEGPAGRASQMNAGAQRARGDILFFLHADTLPPPGYAAAIRQTLESPSVAAGAFRLAIAGQRRGLRLVEKLANWRSNLLQLPYGDQGLFLRTALFRELGGFPQVPLMEDYILVQRLRRRGRIVTRPEAALTSGRRWQTLGLWRTTVINQLMVAGYYGGINLTVLGRWYRLAGRGQSQLPD